MKTFKEILEAIMGTDDSQDEYYAHSKFYNPEGHKLHNNKKLSDHEVNSINEYTRYAHEDINGYHRGLRPNAIKHHKENMIKHTEHIDSAIAKHTTKEDAHVWRGIHGKIIKTLKLNPGDEFHDKGFVSTSFHPAEAKSFSSDNHVMRIYLPKGSKALHLNSHKIGWEQKEDEVLLPRNSKFKYNGSFKHGNTIVHSITHIPESKE